jgi:hypothetical protein
MNSTQKAKTSLATNHGCNAWETLPGRHHHRQHSGISCLGRRDPSSASKAQLHHREQLPIGNNEVKMN